MLKVCLVMAASILGQEILAADTYTFGAQGQRGLNATRGRDGATGQSKSVVVDGSPMSLESPGTPGEDAYGNAENGSSAYGCSQPFKPSYNLSGAAGGRGGDGAAGGDGGYGGDIYLYLASKDKIPLLKKVKISNPGAEPGRSMPRPGRGGQGCYCNERNWQKLMCRWTFYRVVDGQKRSGWTADESIDCTDYRRPPYSKPYPDGDWEVTSTRNDSYECLNGADGQNGYYGGEGRRGSHGTVSIIVGADAQSPRKVSIEATLGEVLEKTYELVNFDQKIYSGLTGLLAPESNVSDTYQYRTLYKRKVKIEWKAKANPKSSGTLDQRVFLDLVGDSINPELSINLPPLLSKQLSVVGDTTVISITHVLKSSDPAKIAACAKHNGKGSYICEFSDQCIYEEGDCLPRF